MDYSHFINSTSRQRQPDQIRTISSLQLTNIISNLAGGRPSQEIIPIQEISIKLKNDEMLHISGEPLLMALQYQATEGVSELIRHLTALQRHYHHPPILPTEETSSKPEHSLTGRTLILTHGAINGGYLALQMILEKKDAVVVEAPTYGGILSVLRPMGVEMLSAEVDGNGLNPSKLRSLLENRRRNNLSMPKCLYTIPSGQNPTGASISLERKKEIYKLACEFNFIIIEDDVYFFLQFEENIPSFLSLDTEGRVLRFDSFSKVISPGIRLGFATGATALMNQILMHMINCVAQACSLSQYIVLEIFKKWGIEGFQNHVQKNARHYKSRMLASMALLQKYLKDDVEVDAPKGGMFLWVKIKKLEDTRLFAKYLQTEGVLVIPGFTFNVDESKNSPFLRISFAMASDIEIEAGFKKMKELLDLYLMSIM